MPPYLQDHTARYHYKDTHNNTTTITHTHQWNKHSIQYYHGTNMINPPRCTHQMWPADIMILLLPPANKQTNPLLLNYNSWMLPSTHHTATYTINMVPTNNYKPKHIDRPSKTSDKRKKQTDKQQQRNRQ